MSKLKVLELFGGIGACSNALKRLNIDYEIVDYVEIDKYAVKSFNAIYDTNFEPQDITNWDKDIEVDLIMHGSPCQDFSLAGKQAGGYEGYYEVSNLGNVRSMDRLIIRPYKDTFRKKNLKGKQVKGCINKNGYVYYYLMKDGKGKNIRGHILVANAFMSKIDGKVFINHIDGNKQNNKLDNLEYCTNQYNVQEAYRLGLTKHYTRKVNQYDKQGNFIRQWNSITEASKCLKIQYSNISACCKGRHKYIGGYIWKYGEE